MSRDLMTVPSQLLDTEPHPTREAAREAGVLGWNLRCNRCGWWGAYWFQGMRPRWGCLALCGPDAAALREEIRRHKRAMATLAKVDFEQPIERAPQGVGVHD